MSLWKIVQIASGAIFQPYIALDFSSGLIFQSYIVVPLAKSVAM
ncbi:MAG: hypothetical protein JWM68_4286 [Verrucomicrobiales bacterium]|nr:hypothetical protein [Verrucomicrobiales bacterium]